MSQNEVQPPNEFVFHDVTHPPFHVPVPGSGEWQLVSSAHVAHAHPRDGLIWVAWQPAGNMVRFRTDSRRIAVNVQLLRKESIKNNTLMQESGIDVYLGNGPQERVPYKISLLNARRCIIGPKPCYHRRMA